MAKGIITSSSDERQFILDIIQIIKDGRNTV